MCNDNDTLYTAWMWVWENSGSWWWTGRPGVLQFMRLQRVGHDWATELNWTGSTPSCGIAGLLDTFMFSFLRTSVMSSLVGVLTDIAPSSVGAFSFLHTLYRLHCCGVFDVAILINVRWYLIIHLICLSLRTSDAEHHFMCFIAISVTSLEKCAFILWLIFYCVFFFFLYWAVLVVCMCWREIPYKYLCLQDFFFYSEGCLFLSLTVSFAVQMLLMFIRSHLLIFVLFSWFYKVDQKRICCILC